jgi:hypothetical protein
MISNTLSVSYKKTVSALTAETLGDKYMKRQSLTCVTAFTLYIFAVTDRVSALTFSFIAGRHLLSKPVVA